MSSVSIVHAHLVLPDAVLEDGAVLIRDGKIVEVGSCLEVAWADADEVIDAGHSLYLLPGLIDTHCDGLEVEINPRPRVNFDGLFAMRNYERRCLMGGVTTSFHALTFADMPRSGRTLEEAALRAELVRESRQQASMDHQLLHRCDVWTPTALDSLFGSLRVSPVQAMSLNDHTPGQGQYRNLDEFKKTMIAYHGADPTYDADADIEKRIAARQDRTPVMEVLGRVGVEFRAQAFVLASHDDDSVERVDAMHELGCTIAEFPVVIEAARRAREIGEWITVGAPNIVRGGSTSGNSDATELVREGLADIICADYHTPSMLVAATKLVDLGICTLPEAVAKVTANPAAAFGLDDRGRIEVGLAGDLVLVDLERGRPRVHDALYRGAVVYSDGRAPRLQERSLALSAR